MDISETSNTELNPELDIENNLFYTDCIFNEDPDFKSTKFNELQIGEESAANSAAITTTNNIDIIGSERDIDNPDIGAYESIIFEEEEETIE